MRIFLIILSIVLCAAAAVLNFLGFQGYLVGIEFYGINLIAEVVVCLLLGHFMYRTYANYKKAKKLTQELATLQSTSQTLSAPSVAKATASAAPAHPQTATQAKPAVRPSAPAKPKKVPLSERQMPIKPQSAKVNTEVVGDNAKHQTLADEAARDAANCDTTALFKAFKG